MKNQKLFIFIILLLFSLKVSAQEICSQYGYTVITINGIFTSEKEALLNKAQLKLQLPPTYNHEPVIVDYVYNPTHLGGIGDIIDIIGQGFFDQKTDYDLVEMLDDASSKISTQKVLLVGHSQGSFYANNFYDKVANKKGGIPSESVGVYNVANPASRVAGNGKYLTSDTDLVISKVIWRANDVMPPNTHIELQANDFPGHNFSNVYLKYRGGKIVSDIKESFDRLENNQFQKTDSPCISPQKISKLHEATGVFLTVADYLVKKKIQTVTYIYNTVKDVADAIDSLFTDKPKNNLALTNIPEDDLQEEVIIDKKLENNASKENDNTVIQKVEQKTSKTENAIVGTTPTTPNIIPIVTIPESTTIISGSGGGGGHHSGGSSSNTDNNDDDNPEPEDEDNEGDEENDDPIETPDKNFPVITLIGDSIISINLNETYIDFGATALDEKDGVINVVTSGQVDTSLVGNYIITYSATDLAGNTTILTRTVKVVNSNPTISKVATLSLPNDGTYVADGLEPSRGRVNLTPFTFQIIYTDTNNNQPENIILHVENTTTNYILPSVKMKQIETKASNILNDGFYNNGEIFTFTDVYDEGNYSYYFTAKDKNGDFLKTIEDAELLRFSAIPSTYMYIPQYTFGRNNGDGNDWQVWSFNGSNVYDWSDTYVDGYLHEQFKIQTYKGGFWCSQCLQRGIFNHDPRKGFEAEDLATSGLDSNPQNSMNGVIYKVEIQWGPTGYSYKVTYDHSTVFGEGYTEVPNVNSDTWVGWNGSHNGFTRFPSGDWQGVPYESPMDRTGGSGMVLMPYPVYDPDGDEYQEDEDEDDSPEESSEKLITYFSFENLNPKVEGIIDDVNKTIKLTVPYGTLINSISPVILKSNKSLISPNENTPQDFTNAVTYTVIAEDGSMSVYTVSVTVLPDESGGGEALPTITNYTLNGTSSDITIDPTKNNLEMIFSASENVNWVSIEIENQNDSNIRKIFYSGDGCKDDTSSCVKTWNGSLSGSGLVLENGSYQIKVHIKDIENNDCPIYNVPSIITVDKEEVRLQEEEAEPL